MTATTEAIFIFCILTSAAIYLFGTANILHYVVLAFISAYTVYHERVHPTSKQEPYFLDKDGNKIIKKKEI